MAKLGLYLFSLLVLLIPLTYGFGNIFDFIRGAHNEAQDGSGGGGSAPDGQRCAGYLCEFGGRICVREPSDCPCRPAEFKCVYGNGKDFTCVPSEAHCSTLKKMID